MFLRMYGIYIMPSINTNYYNKTNVNSNTEENTNCVLQSFKLYITYAFSSKLCIKIQTDYIR